MTAFLDTNVLVRHLTGDPPDLAQRATEFLAEAEELLVPDLIVAEVVYVLEGNGALHIDGESTPLRPGSCVHLPAKLVHSLENHGPGEMQVLGVFRPAGSPAEAYYPDGTPAVQY